MAETEHQFKGIRGFLWLSFGFLLLAAGIGSAVYIVVHLVTDLLTAQANRNVRRDPHP